MLIGLLNLFKKKNNGNPKSEEITLKLVPNGETVTYGDVIGFFKFRDTIYFRTKGVSGREVENVSVSFTDSIKKAYPEEFAYVLAKDISNIAVQPLNVIK